MKTYAVIDDTGAVLRIVRQDAEPRESCIELDVEVASWPKPPHQNATLVMSNGALTWRDERSIDEAKQQTWARLKAERQAAIEAPKTTSLGVFDATIAAQDNLSKVIAMLRIAIARGAPDAANFTLASNERKTFTLTQLETAALEIGAQVQTAFDVGDTLRRQVQQASAAATLDAMQWPE